MRRRSLAVTFVAAAIAFSSVAPQFVPTATSAPRSDPRAEREQVRAEKAKVASQIDVKKASQRQIQDALQTIDENLQTQEAALTRTQSEVAQAKQDIADAQKAISRLTKQVEILRVEMKRRAVRAYVSPPGDDVLTVLETKDFTSASSRKFFIELRAQDDADVADRLDGATTDLQYQRRKANAAKKRAVRKEAEQTRRTDAVRQARAQQQDISDSITASINSDVDRSIQLAATDRKLSAQIAAEAAARQAQLLAAKAAQEARNKAAAQAAAAAEAARNRQNTPDPTDTQTSNGGERDPLPPVGSSGGGTGTGGISLCNVGGITVNCAIKGQLQSMMNAAAADGIHLAGGGYRDPQQQIELRREHCGSSYYAIYQMSSSSCHPPTAIPGTSQHELGLAIDFSPCGRGSAMYNWLSSNASRFGFYNLPSESWHWSTSGR